MLIAAIDPGFAGALAIIDAGLYCQTWDMPVHVLSRGGKTKREIDAHALADLLRADRIDHLFIEAVGAMPGQGVSGVFAFGKGFGIVVGVASAIGIPMTFVPPATWKRALTVPAAKDGARARASQLLPGAAFQWPLVKHDGRAESALLALYGVRTLNGRATAEAPSSDDRVFRGVR